LLAEAYFDPMPRKKRNKSWSALQDHNKRQKDNADLQPEVALQLAKSAAPAATTSGAEPKRGGRVKGQKDSKQRKRRNHAHEDGDVETQTPISKRAHKRTVFFSPASDQDIK
jgi:hypothetical protein